jgi:pyridoxal phosphate enzyme (YggS family)
MEQNPRNRDPLRAETLRTRLELVRRQIAAAERRAGRSHGAVRLLAVSKGFAAEDIRTAYAAGQRDFGESYAQEAAPKIATLTDCAICWHFIGPLQSNKTRVVAEHFDWVHSVDRIRIARRLAEQCPPGREPLNVCLQVRIGAEKTKSGVDPDELAALAGAVAALPRLRLRGLMTIPAPSDDPQLQRVAFRHLRELQESLIGSGYSLDTLSMGMTDDLEAAVMEGATMVRVGTGIFGARLTGRGP